MIAELFSLCALFISTIGWGIWIKFFFSIKNDSFSLTSVLGLAVAGFLYCLFSFFHPLDLKAELILLIVSVIPYFIKKTRAYTGSFPKETIQSARFWTIFCIILLAGSYYCFRPDHFTYYLPTLNWLNEYGLIKGIAVIDWNLGQMSLLHFIQAGFDNTIDIYQRINILISVIFLLYVFERKSYLLLLFLPFYFLFIQSSSPDIPVVFFSLLVVNELCFYPKKNNFKILLIISSFVFAIKPVAFWLPMWVFSVGILQYKKDILCYKNYIFPGLLLLIFLFKNYIASSVLFFPVTLIKMNTYWLTDARILDMSDRFAAFYTFDYHFTSEEIQSLSFFQRLYYWLTIPELQTIINLSIFFILIFFGIFSFTFKRKIIYQILWGIIVLKFFLTFNFSGQYRFILDGIYPLLFIMLCHIKLNANKIFTVALAYSFLFLILISFPSIIKTIIPGFHLTSRIRGFTSKSLLRPENYSLKKYKKEKIGNLNFNLSTAYIHNFDTPAPAFEVQKLASYYNLGIFPQMKDSSGTCKGFYMKSLSKEESSKLKKLISDLNK